MYVEVLKKGILPYTFTASCPYSISQYFPCRVIKVNLTLFKNCMEYREYTLHDLTSSFLHFFTVINYAAINILVNMSQNTWVCIFFLDQISGKEIFESRLCILYMLLATVNLLFKVLPFTFITGMCCFSSQFLISFIFLVFSHFALVCHQ